MRLMALLVLAACAGAQPAPVFQARDVRPQGSAEPRPLLPRMGVWIFGEHLGPPCGVENVMDPRTYKTELCGVRVLFGGVPAELLFTSPTQINLIAPDRPWRDEMVNVQVIHDGGASAVVPVRFGSDRPELSIAEPVFTGMPVWVHVELPWRKGSVQYPYRIEPWSIAGGYFDVRFEGRDLPLLPTLPYLPVVGDSYRHLGLPTEPRKELLDRAPLHLQYAFDRPGAYELRYRDPESGWSEWIQIDVKASTIAQRRAWFEKLIAAQPKDTTELLADFLPSLLAFRDEAALRVLAPFLDSPDQIVRQYTGYALHYFDPALRARVVPGRKPPCCGVVM